MHPACYQVLKNLTLQLKRNVFDFIVRHRKGRCNIVPDTLSRIIAEEQTSAQVAMYQAKGMGSDLPISWEEIGDQQQSDTSLKPLWDAAKTKPVDPNHIHYTICNGYLFRCVPHPHEHQSLQVVVPAPLRQQFLQYAHDNPFSGHLGRMKTLRRLLGVLANDSQRHLGVL